MTLPQLAGAALLAAPFITIYVVLVRVGLFTAILLAGVAGILACILGGLYLMGVPL
jgi:hypothetical protein